MSTDPATISFPDQPWGDNFPEPHFDSSPEEDKDYEEKHKFDVIVILAEPF